MKRRMTISLSMMVVLLILVSSDTLRAQQTTTTAKGVVQKQANNADVVKVTKRPNDSPSGVSGFVYENYKGITNREEAKKAWIKDNPEAYKKITHPTAPSSTSNANGKNDSH